MRLNNCNLKYLLSCHEKLLDGVRSQIPFPEDADDHEDADDPEDADGPVYGSNTGYSRKSTDVHFAALHSLCQLN